MKKVVERILSHFTKDVTFDYSFKNVSYKIEISLSLENKKIRTYKNNEKIFSCSNEGLSLFNFANEDIIPSLLQSFATYLARHYKENSQDSVSKEIHPEFEDKPLADGLEQISEDFHGGSEATGSVENSQSGFGGSESSLPDENQEGADVEEAEAGDPVPSRKEGVSENSAQQDSKTTPAETGRPGDGGELDGGGSSSAVPEGNSISPKNDSNNCERNGVQDGSPEEEEHIERSSFDMQRVYHDPYKPQKQDSAVFSSGGSQWAIAEDSSADERIARSVERLLSGAGVRKIEGYDHYWSKPLIKSIVKKDFRKLPDAKYKKETEKIFLVLDTSGSVRHLTNMISKVAKSCVKSQKIEIWYGSEAHPCARFSNEFKEEIPYNHSFYKDLQLFIKRARPSFGSTLIFFGDLWGVHMWNEKDKIKKILKNYKAIWFCSEGRDCSNEWRAAQKAGFKLVFDVVTVEKFVAALKTFI